MKLVETIDMIIIEIIYKMLKKDDYGENYIKKD